MLQRTERYALEWRSIDAPGRRPRGAGKKGVASVTLSTPVYFSAKIAFGIPTDFSAKKRVGGGIHVGGNFRGDSVELFCGAGFVVFIYRGI